MVKNKAFNYIYLRAVTIFTDKLQIGKFRLKNRAFLAPMAGITDAPFRSIVSKYGAGLVVSEMIASASLSTGQQEMLRRMEKSSENLHQDNLPHMVQLSGNEPHWLEIGAKMAVHAGADIIDINFGCPSKRVTSGFAGAALMRNPDKALTIIEAVANAIDIPITVKMRLGWDKDNINVVQIAKLAQNAGAQMIFVHARTRQQFYKGQADWAKVRPVVEDLDIPVIINGDIIDADSAKKAIGQSGAAGVMIGRKALGRPWIVGQIGAVLQAKTAVATPSNSTFSQLILDHYKAMLNEYGEQLGVRVARKHLKYYLDSSNIRLEKQELRHLLTNNVATNVINHLTQIFNQNNSVTTLIT